MTNDIHSEKYTILYKGNVLYQNLTETEYFDILEDLAVEYYQNGSPHPSEITTQIIKGD
jgi:hypothetical protein